MTGLDPAVADRLRRRYPPPRVPRPVIAGLVAVVTLVGLGWLVWAALDFSRPVVSAQVAAYTVTSNTTIDVTLTVDRTDPSVPVTCRLVAEDDGHLVVGEKQVRIEADPAKVVDLKITLTTLRRAVTAVARDCARA